MLPNETRLIPVNPDTRGYTSEFDCERCNGTIFFSYYIKRCDYEYCPWCGRKTIRDSRDRNEWSDYIVKYHVKRIKAVKTE